MNNKRLGISDSLVDSVRAVLSGKPNTTQEDIERRADAKMVKVRLPDGRIVFRRERSKIEIGKGKNEAMDPVDPKALKGKHKDRKDKDIDNDGDVDKSDEYLHKRRQAVSKAMKEEVELDEATPTRKQVKQAIGIARDKRYAGGNMTGATKQMDKINKGLQQHPAVRKELQKQNEDSEENPANTQHLCAKNVVHESWGEGICIPTMHADPDEEGNIEWYDVMFDHGIEEKVSIDSLEVTLAEAHTHKKSVKEDEDEDEDEDDDDDDDDNDNDNGKKKKGKKDEIDTEPSMKDVSMVSEKDMSPAQMKKREEIVKSMKKKMPDFQKKYGDRAKDVMYATATKMAMKEGFDLSEETFHEIL